MEYFEGILFLATNRVEEIDPAFKSRMHFSICYPGLSFDSRRALWQVFAAKAAGLEQPGWLNGDFLDNVAAFELNGRQIKNAARVAHALAANQNRSLEREDVLSTLRALTSFYKDFIDHSVKRTEGTANGNTTNDMTTDGKGEVAERCSKRSKRRRVS